MNHHKTTTGHEFEEEVLNAFDDYNIAYVEYRKIIFETEQNCFKVLVEEEIQWENDYNTFEIMT